MVESLTAYFSLAGPRAVLGTGNGEQSNRDQIILFAGVAFGASAKVIYDALTSTNSSIELSAFVVALIASLVIFPTLHYTAGLNKNELSFAHWALAFQNGFFWSVAFDQIAQRMAGG